MRSRAPAGRRALRWSSPLLLRSRLPSSARQQRPRRAPRAAPRGGPPVVGVRIALRRRSDRAGGHDRGNVRRHLAPDRDQGIVECGSCDSTPSPVPGRNTWGARPIRADADMVGADRRQVAAQGRRTAREYESKPNKKASGPASPRASPRQVVWADVEPVCPSGRHRSGPVLRRTGLVIGRRAAKGSAKAITPGAAGAFSRTDDAGDPRGRVEPGRDRASRKGLADEVQARRLQRPESLIAVGGHG